MKKATAQIQTPKSFVADSPANTGNRKHYGIVLALFGFLLFANTIPNEYALDDAGAINNNLFVQKGISGIPELLTADLWHFDNVNLGYYRPLSLITFAIEVQFFGLSPHVSHFGNVMLFSITIFVLFQLLTSLFQHRSVWFSIVIALLFAAHPIHTEVVANIKSRDEILSFLNLCLCLLFLVRFSENGKVMQMLLSSFFFYLALLSKETAIVGVLLFPLVLFILRPVPIRKLLSYAGVLTIVAAVFLFQKKTMMGTLLGEVPIDIVNYPYTTGEARIATAFVIFIRLIWLLFVPFQLKYDYSYNSVPASDFQNPMTFIGILVAGMLVYFMYKNYKNKKEYSISYLWFLVTLAPAMGFVVLRGGIMAERFLYAPTLGFCLWLTILLFKSFSFNESTNFNSLKTFFSSNKSFTLLITLLVIIYSSKTIARNTTWKNNFTLFTNDIKHNQQSAQNHRHTGSEYINQSIAEKDSTQKQILFRKGVSELHKALYIHPMFGDAYFKLGVAYHAAYLNVDSAIYFYTKATETAPGYAISFNNLGILYQGLKKYELSSYYYNKAIELNPNFPDAKRNAENLKKQTGLDVHVFPTGMNLDSLQQNTENKNDNFYFNLGTMYASKGDYTNAMVNLKKASELNPNNLDAFINLGNCYGIMKKYQESIQCNMYVLQKDPNNARALQNIMISYDQLGEKAKAQEYRERLSQVVGR